ncbi:PrgI family protein, partial [Frankia sp. R82]|nr:PrgI family protein [Frankia sp. R82]
AHTRLARRLAEATDLLAPAGIVVTPLDAGTATSVLAAACNPAGLVPPAALAAPDEVITGDLPEGYAAYQPDPGDDGFLNDDGSEDPDAAVEPGYSDRFDDGDGHGPLDPDFWDPPAPRSEGGSRRSTRHTARRGQAR